ncbi:arylsulfatase [Vallitalea longa]|uniref:Arylsulfatase n=1 Tax=Vallitalea longa TaxID=2936439 RepID=A0A9W5YEZ5_9FIRM|nr:sulfatase-like hydrolase/transferase [Vallitalea longa]GKX31496.1 arylsulfatase [Vallitalea longa]
MNFVFFFPDEMRAESLSCYGNQSIKTPNYDRFAKEGVKFDNCFVQNPVCSPSRCCLMTGRYVHNNGHRSLWHLLRPHEPSLFRYLHNEGYKIGWFGKNDLYSEDYIREFNFTSSPECKGGTGKPVKNIYEPSNEKYHSFVYEACDEGDGLAGKSKLQVEKAIEFLENHKDSDEPFFLYIPIGLPHPPYYAPEKYYDMYNVDDISQLKMDVDKDRPLYYDLIRKYRNLDKLSEDELKKIQAIYYGMISYTDMLFGKLLDAIDACGMNETTTVIASSDHGDFAGDYGLVEKWPNAFTDNITRVPLIISTPDNKKGHKVNEQVELFDIMSTVLELADIKAEHTNFSQSLVPQLAGSCGDKDRIVYCEGGYDKQEPHAFESFVSPCRNKNLTNENHPYYPKIMQQANEPKSVCRSVMMRTLDYKLIRRTEDINELYDLNKDPNEIYNVYEDDRYRSIRSDMENKLIDWYLKTSDTIPFNDDIRGFAID